MARWTKKKLHQVVCSAGDIAAHQIRIVPLQLYRRPDTARKNSFSKSRREALDLRFDSARHVAIAFVWHMAVRPGRVTAFGSTCRIEQARLRQEHKGLVVL